MTKRVGLLTGGGDAPGLNGVIESFVRALVPKGYTVIGIRDGFEGVFQHDVVELSPDSVRGEHRLAGTLLGTSNRSSLAGRETEFRTCFHKLNLDCLVAAGGDGTFAGLSRVINGLNLIGVPKTIDNDLAGTDVTFGYDTACAVVSEAADSLRATADAHQRIMVIETMGRTAGWIALGGGLASYADVILIPERPFNREALLSHLRTRHDRTANSFQRSAIIVASEGAAAENENASIAFEVPGSPQAERYGGFAEKLARWLEAELGWESRHVTLGHLQRSRHPTTTDRFLTLAIGIEAANLVYEQAWGHAVVYRGGCVTRASLNELMQPTRLVASDHRWVQMAQNLGIFI